jgi:hypothetical protein
MFPGQRLCEFNVSMIVQNCRCDLQVKYKLALSRYIEPLSAGRLRLGSGRVGCCTSSRLLSWLNLYRLCVTGKFPICRCERLTNLAFRRFGSGDI